MKRAFLALLVLAGASPALAASQPAAPGEATVTVDPARLAAARQLMDQIMPPDQRESMITQMMTPMIANMRAGIAQSPGFAALLQRDPRTGAMLDQFIDRQFTRSIEVMRAVMPGLIDAMTRAYARRFTVDQLAEVTAFYRTPTGRAFTAEAQTIMNDPDVAAWQRSMMARSMGTIQADVAQFVRDAEAKAQQP